MSNFWNWLKNVFAKILPIKHTLSLPVHPSLTPKIDAAAAAYSAVKEALHEKA